mgnify:CR=1 FL=1
MTPFAPTDEQAFAIDLFASGENLAIEAGAGTGKTSTLIMLGEVASGRGQYVAFNRSIVNEAKRKMPRNVAARTMHSLAFRDVGTAFAHRLDGDRITSTDIARRLRVPPMQVPIGSRSKTIQLAQLGGLVMKALNEFCKSADPEPALHHVPRLEGIDDPFATGPNRGANNRAVAEAIMPYVHDAWADACNPAGKLSYNPSRYLKLWQLSNPRMACDFLLFDEAQDVSPVMLSIVEQQADHCQLVFVGDPNQSIYEWLGAVDAMDAVPAAYRTYLSQSFRFGDEIADLANLVLEDLGAPVLLRGNPGVDSTVGSLDTPDVVLTRSNATAVAKVMAAVKANVPVHLMGGADDVVRFAEAAEQLQTTGSTWHPELSCFESWAEVQVYVESDLLGEDLALLVKLVDEFGAREMVDALAGLPSEDRARLVVSTGHKTKGREWATVQLASDFGKPFDGDDDEDPAAEEKRLLYVAVTRARLRVDVDAVPYFTPGQEARHVL